MTIVFAFCKEALPGHTFLQRLLEVLYISKGVTLPIRFGVSSSWQRLTLALCLTGMLTYMRIVLHWFAVLRSALARHCLLRVVHRTPSATEPAILATVTLRRSVRYMGRTLGRTRQLVVLHTSLFYTGSIVQAECCAVTHSGDV